MQFILESQAKAEVRADRAEMRADRNDARNDARINALEKRLDKRMDAITKILQQGMRMLAQTDIKLKELAQAQKETDRSLKAFINSLRHQRPLISATRILPA